LILVDTSVWVAHLRTPDGFLARRLETAAVCSHPYVIGEIALGQLRQREVLLNLLSHLPMAVVASHEEALRFIDQRRLFGRGIGYVDVCLLAAAQLTPDARLWTLDKRLDAVARELELAAPPTTGGA
jgi:predicted nucleic acid-binding protein